MGQSVFRVPYFVVLKICLPVGVLPEVNGKIYTGLPDLQELILETFPKRYSFM